MEDSELTAICEALIDADPTMSGYHESHIAVKMPYALAVQKRLSSMPKMHTDDMNDIVLTGLALEEAKREIERLRSLTTWQPMETAPRDGTWFIATYDGAGGYELMQWVTPPDGRETGLYLAGYSRPWGRAIAWLPLPTPPEADT